MKDRRRYIRLLRHLLAAPWRYESALETRFGVSVHAELKALFLANHIEPDLGEKRKWRLTCSGRNEARRVMGGKVEAA